METRILIVDADASLLDLMNRVLSATATILCARTVEEARAAVTEPPDVVVAAAELKTPQGECFLDWVRNHWGFGVRRIWLTDTPSVLEGRIDQGFDAGLRRPLYDAELIRRTVLPAKRQRGGPESMFRDSWLTDHITDGILVVDYRGRITLLNPAAAALLEVDLHDAVGRSMDEAGLPPALRDVCEEVRSSGQAVTSVFALTDDRMLRVTSAAHAHRTGGTYTVMRDITAEVRVQELRHHYLNIVSHELRTPLTALSNFVSLWDRHEDEPDKPDRHKLIDGIRQQSMRLAHQIDKLILLARLERDAPAVDPEIFDVGVALREAVETCRLRARQQGTEFRIQVPDGPLQACGDREDFRRALYELAENAVKFTPPGGEVEIRASVQDGRFILIEVADNGIGIDPADQGAIFDAFRQLEQPLTRTYGGAGLGLALARRIVEPWQGTLEVESTVGTGATFRLRIPAATKDPVRPELSVSGSHEDNHGS